MGIVYEGFDPVLQRTVAIKTILPAQLEGSELVSVLARFKREAQAAGRLNHPGIVAVYEYGEVDAEDDNTIIISANSPPLEGQRVAFIAMEFVAGRELKDYFDDNERFSLKEVGRIMGEILDALDHAHGKGVTHRDMKPANLIVLPDGRVKIADFGIARIETSELTLAGTVMGTPSYMSPEQFQGQTVDFRSDLFSCGVILYQFLTGEKPFIGNMASIMYKVLREEPVPPSALNAALPPVWDRVVEKAIAKNPEARFQSAKAFEAAIRDAVASQASHEANLNPTPTPKPIPTRAPLVPAMAASEPVGPVVQAAVPTRQNTQLLTKAAKAVAVPGAPKPIAPAMWVWGIAGVVLLGAAGAYLVSGKQRGGTSPVAKTPTSTTPSPAVSAVSAPLSVASATATAPAPAPAPAPIPPPPPPPPPLPLPLPLPPPLPAATATATTPAPTSPALAPELAPASAPSSPPAVAVADPLSAHEPRNKQVRRPVAASSVALHQAEARPAVERAPPRAPPRAPRCVLILQKAAMSEPISAEERTFLTSSCQ